MVALPKKKHTNHRQGLRRSHDKIKVPPMMTCPQCRQLKVTHRVCPTCGTYKGRQVLKIEVKRPAE